MRVSLRFGQKYDYVFLNGLWGTLWLAFVTVLFRNYFRNSGGSVKTFQMQSLSGTDRSVHRSSQGHSDPAPVIFLLAAASEGTAV